MDPTDVRSPGGWLRTYAVRVAKTLVIGAVGGAAVLQIYGPIDFQTGTGTSTGTVLRVNGVTAWQAFPVACTSTGGLTKYPTCIASSPYSTTGALLDVAIDCGNTKVAMIMSGSFVKSNAATTFGQTVLRNVTVGTGAVRSKLAQSGTHLLWNPADKIRLTTTTATPNSAANCTMWVYARDKSGS